MIGAMMRSLRADPSGASAGPGTARPVARAGRGSGRAASDPRHCGRLSRPLRPGSACLVRL